MNLGYLGRILGGASFKRMKHTIDEVHEKSGKNKVATFFDMIGCGIKYGAGYNDYNILGDIAVELGKTEEAVKLYESGEKALGEGGNLEDGQDLDL